MSNFPKPAHCAGARNDVIIIIKALTIGIVWVAFLGLSLIRVRVKMEGI